MLNRYDNRKMDFFLDRIYRKFSVLYQTLSACPADLSRRSFNARPPQ